MYQKNYKNKYKGKVMNKLIENKLRRLVQKEIKSVLKEEAHSEDIYEIIDDIDTHSTDMIKLIHKFIDIISSEGDKYDNISQLEASNLNELIVDFDRSYKKWKANYL